MTYKLMQAIQQDKARAAQELANTLAGRADYADFHAILTNLPDDVELATVHASDITNYVIATLLVGVNHRLQMSYNRLTGTINVGIGGFLPKELSALGADFWRNPAVIRACRIWIEKR